MEKLIETLEGQLALYREMLDLSREKKDIIIAGDVGKLNEIVDQEKGLLIQADALEHSRTRITSEIGQKLDIDGPTLDDLIAHSQPPQAIALRELKFAFEDVFGELKRLNATNKKLIDTNIEYIDFMMNLASTAGEVNNLYEHSGGAGGNKATSLGIFDASI